MLARKLTKLLPEDHQQVFLIGWDGGNQTQNKVKDPGVNLASVDPGSIWFYNFGQFTEQETPNTIWLLPTKMLAEQINKHCDRFAGVIHILEETVPNQGSRQHIPNPVHILGKEVMGGFIHINPGKGMIFIVKKHSLVILWPIILDNGFLLRLNENLLYIICAILPEESYFDLMGPESFEFIS